MKLNRITITGADETVNPQTLINLSEEYPFVEWGILFSETNQGKKRRYPCIEWINELIELKKEQSNININLSAHICGKYTKDILKGENEIPNIVFENFNRIQLNFNSFVYDVYETAFLKILENDFKNKEVICQLRNDPSDNLFWRISHSLFKSEVKLVGLFDKSGGTGLTINNYPIFNSLYNDYFGYAGGINHENIEAVIENIKTLESNQNFWIDMESGVRSDIKEEVLSEEETVFETILDAFDHYKVEKCLKIASKYIV